MPSAFEEKSTCKPDPEWMVRPVMSTTSHVTLVGNPAITVVPFTLGFGAMVHGLWAF